MAGSRKLVIVESPAKARTIAGYLGDNFDVKASVGHVRDLPQPSDLPAELKKGPFGKFAVNVEDGFEPYYVVDPGKKSKVAELKRALKDADELYLATDEDREGEAIAWHLLQVLKPKVPVKRMVFHEITKDAIQNAIAHPRDLDLHLVDAQETRRILDRLYGYEVSPVLWRKVKVGLSAGRVQSVATRMVVERERERMSFMPAEYWDLAGQFAASDVAGSFEAKLSSVDAQRVASGRDFDDSGALKSKSVVVLDGASARSLAEGLQGVPFAVRDVASKPYTRRPAAPFTTSTLQQEASRKLRLNAQTTMRLAQRLYEAGYITYMRTDSTNLSSQAISAARTQASELYGPQAIPSSPRLYASKSKGAQEAHEAIRPAGGSFKKPAELPGSVDSDQRRLYELIWMRTMASQMSDAKGQTATVKLGALAPDGRDAEFTASGTVITSPGFLAAYEEGRDAGRYSEDKQSERRLPPMEVGQSLKVSDLGAEGHQTTPPPRYTEASLVAALEARGIGRPSTYAATIGVIVDRGYVLRRGQALVPSWLAFAVTRLLEEHFGELVDYDFTAEMEAGLDRIAGGDGDRASWLNDFYFGRGDEAVSTEGASLEDLGLKRLVDDLGDIDARDINSVPLGDGIVLRVGRYGPYVEVPSPQADADPLRASVPPDLAPDELTVDKAHELLEKQAVGDRELGTDPESGHMIVAKDGRYGPYVTEVLPEDGEPKKRGAKKVKPRTASLFKSMSLDTVNLEDALRLLSQPRTVGTDPESGEEITAQNGRFGPYLKKGTDSRSLEDEEQIFTVTLDEALKIYQQPKRGRGARSVAALRELGEDPATSLQVSVKEGRFGPYVTDGTTNATLRQADDPQTVTLDRASELLAEKRAKGPSTRKRKAPAKKKTAAKKPAAKKTAPKKQSAKKD